MTFGQRWVDVVLTSRAHWGATSFGRHVPAGILLFARVLRGAIRLTRHPTILSQLLEKFGLQKMFLVTYMSSCSEREWFKFRLLKIASSVRGLLPERSHPIVLGIHYG